MKVRDIASKGTLTIQDTESLRRAAETMTEEEVGALLVYAGGQPAGVISERDLVTALNDGADPDLTEVGDYMTRAIASIDEGAGIEEAVARMHSWEIRHLIVNRGKEPAGVISLRDILGFFNGDGGAR